MNKNNLIFWYDNNTLYAEWTSRDRNDQDDDGTPIILVSTEARGLDDIAAKKTLNTMLATKYDEWIRTTRGT